MHRKSPPLVLLQYINMAGISTVHLYYSKLVWEGGGGIYRYLVYFMLRVKWLTRRNRSVNNQHPHQHDGVSSLYRTSWWPSLRSWSGFSSRAHWHYSIMRTSVQPSPPPPANHSRASLNVRFPPGLTTLTGRNQCQVLFSLRLSELFRFLHNFIH